MSRRTKILWNVAGLVLFTAVGARLFTQAADHSTAAWGIVVLALALAIAAAISAER